MDDLPRVASTGARITAALLVGGVFAVVAWDVYAGIRWGAEATISHVLSGWVQRWPIIAFVSGVVAGHIFWQLK